MASPTRAIERGFSYLMLLLWLAIGGATLAALGTSWQTMGQREREMELAFRGEQYAQALRAYAQPLNENGCLNVIQYPVQLKELLDDKRCGLHRRHLRRLYPDPITGEAEWGLYQVDGRILGVYSRSSGRVLRKVDGALYYRDWVFMASEEGAFASAAASAASAASSP